MFLNIFKYEFGLTIFINKNYYPDTGVPKDNSRQSREPAGYRDPDLSIKHISGELDVWMSVIRFDLV